MSSYSDWKCGAISDEEYVTMSRMEAAREAFYDHEDFNPCDFCECCIDGECEIDADPKICAEDML